MATDARHGPRRLRAVRGHW